MIPMLPILLGAKSPLNYLGRMWTMIFGLLPSMNSIAPT